MRKKVTEELATTPVEDLDPRALELNREALVVDAHVDTVIHLDRGGRGLASRGRGHLDLERLRAAGVNVLFFAHYIRPQFKPHLALAELMTLMDRTLGEAEGEGVAIVTDAPSARRAAASGQLGLYLTIEGGEVLHGRPEILRVIHRLGFRSMSLTWNQRNQLADGVWERSTGGGLSSVGAAVVREMSRLGMLVDVAHLSEAGFWDVMETADPGRVIASHANASALCAHPRNLSDEQIKGLAQHGGVMGITLAPDFVHPTDPCLLGVLDHLEHAVSLVGPDHVGLGTDFDGIRRTPRGLSDVSCLPRITAGLLARGWRPGEIRKVLGENFLRVMG